MSIYITNKAAELGKAVGPSKMNVNPRVGKYTIVPYQSTHNTGGAVMGSDPSTSAVNRYLHSWHVPNVFVVAPSAFPQHRRSHPPPPASRRWGRRVPPPHQGGDVAREAGLPAGGGGRGTPPESPPGGGEGGGRGVRAPGVRSAEEGEEAGRAAKSPPLGERGLAPGLP